MNKLFGLAAAAALLLSATAGLAAPPPISNSLVMQFDATNIDGSNNSTLTNGQKVTTWKDATGNGHDMTTEGGTPIFRSSFAQTSTGAPSLPVVYFHFSDGQADWMGGSSATDVVPAAPMTIFVVSTIEDQTNGGARQGTASAFTIGSNTVAGQYFLTGPNDPDMTTSGTAVNVSAQKRYNNGFDPLATMSGSFSDGDLHVIRTLFRAANYMDVRVDGQQGPTQTGFTDLLFPGSTSWRIGALAGPTTGTAELNARIAEVLVYNGEVSGTNLSAVEDYLRTKWHGALPDATASLTYNSETTGFTFPTTGTATVVNNGLSTLTITNATANKGSFGSDTFTIAPLSFPVKVGPRGGTFDFKVFWQPQDVVGVRDFSIDLASDNPIPLKVSVKAAILGGIATDLVTYYNFNQTTGNTVPDLATGGNDDPADVIGNGLDQQTTPSLNAGFGKAYRASNPGSALPFNNSNYISIDGTMNGTRDASIPTDLHFGTAPFTVSCWVKLEKPNNGQQVIFGSVDWNRSAEANGQRDGISLYRDGQMWVADYANSTGFGVGEYRLNINVGNDAGVWHNWVNTVKPGDARWYLDGVEVMRNTSVSGDIGAANVPFILGNNAVPGGGLGGVTECDFDEFAVWHRVLDAAEVRQISDQGRQGITLLDVGPQPAVGITTNIPGGVVSVSGGKTITFNFTLTNEGQAPLTINAGTNLSGANASLFTIGSGFDTTQAFTLNPGESKVIPVIFGSSESGTFHATLNLTHNQATSGTATHYDFTVQGSVIPNSVNPGSWVLY